MHIRRWIGQFALGAALVLSAQAQAQPSNMRSLQGQSFWEGDPGPIYDSYWTSGQYKYDPNGYMERDWWDPEFHLMTVIGNHSGKTNCVFRKRVQITSWDFRHPILRVCRTTPVD